MTNRSFPVDRGHCFHEHIHARRLAVGHTICLNCGTHVCVTEAHFANGESPVEQATRMLAELDAASPCAEWRCHSCSNLIGIERDGELHLKYKDAEFFVRGGFVRAPCRRCGRECSR